MLYHIMRKRALVRGGEAVLAGTGGIMTDKRYAISPQFIAAAPCAVHRLRRGACTSFARLAGAEGLLGVRVRVVPAGCSRRVRLLRNCVTAMSKQYARNCMSAGICTANATLGLGCVSGSSGERLCRGEWFMMATRAMKGGMTMHTHWVPVEMYRLFRGIIGTDAEQISPMSTHVDEVLCIIKRLCQSWTFTVTSNTYFVVTRNLFAITL